MAESIGHRAAKSALASWLRGRSRVGANFKGLQPVLDCVPLSLDKPMFGVYEEYPVCTAANGTLVGLDLVPHAAPEHRVGEGGNVVCADTTGWHCWAASYGKIASKQHQIPTQKDIKKWNLECGLQDHRLRSLYFFDIGVVNPEGRLSTVFEIKHTHPTTDDKIAWLEQHNVRWFEVSADWILSRVNSPFSIAGSILRPWRDDKCAGGCGEGDQRLATDRKLGRWWCCSCTEEKSLCRHVDCVDFRDEKSNEWCSIHARLVD